MKTKKETIEFDSKFFEKWNLFCLSRGISKRQACHAALMVFMDLSAEERQSLMVKVSDIVNTNRKRLGKRDDERRAIGQKETIEYDFDLLELWSSFCDSKGYVKRHASVAARFAFMDLSAEEREAAMSLAINGRARAKEQDHPVQSGRMVHAQMIGRGTRRVS